jgi:hypothetical protein
MSSFAPQQLSSSAQVGVARPPLRIVVGAKELIWAGRGYRLQKIGERSELGVASTFLVERAGAHEESSFGQWYA